MLPFKNLQIYSKAHGKIPTINYKNVKLSKTHIKINILYLLLITFYMNIYKIRAKFLVKHYNSIIRFKLLT